MEQRGDENGRAEHGKHMLNAQRDCLPERRPFIDLDDFFHVLSSFPFVLHFSGDHSRKIAAVFAKTQKKSPSAAEPRSEVSFLMRFYFLLNADFGIPQIGHTQSGGSSSKGTSGSL